MAVSGSSLPTCRCGHDRTHHTVDAEPRYGFWAWVKLLTGITAAPKEVTWRCRRCGEVLGRTRNPRELEAYR